MIKQIHLTTIVWAVFIILAVMMFLEGTQVTTGLFKPCGIVGTALGLLLLAFDQWAWGFRFLHPWFVDRPYLKGSWKGVLQTNHKDESGTLLSPLTVYLVIRQTFSSIHLRLYTPKSQSHSFSSTIDRSKDGVYVIASIYHSTPIIEKRTSNPEHDGAFLLSVQGDPVQSLLGRYWTSRLTEGEARFSERSKTVYFSYEDAENGHYLPMAH